MKQKNIIQKLLYLIHRFIIVWGSFGIVVMFRVESWSGFCCCIKILFAKLSTISSMPHLFTTSGIIPSSPGAFPFFTCFFAAPYSSIVKSVSSICRSFNTVSISISSDQSVEGVPSKFLKWVYHCFFRSSGGLNDSFPE